MQRTMLWTLTDYVLWQGPLGELKASLNRST